MHVAECPGYLAGVFDIVLTEMDELFHQVGVHCLVEFVAVGALVLLIPDLETLVVVFEEGAAHLHLLMLRLLMLSADCLPGRGGVHEVQEEVEFMEEGQSGLKGTKKSIRPSLPPILPRGTVAGSCGLL